MSNFLDELRSNNLLFPDYENSNLSAMKDIVNHSCKAAPKEKTVVLLVDGFGYNLVDNLLADLPDSFLKTAKINKISTLFPSSTPSILTSLESGMTPAEHGIIGWDIYLKEFGSVVTPYMDSLAFSNAKLSDDDIDIRTMFPSPSLLNKAASNGGLTFLCDKHIRKPYDMTNWHVESYTMQLEMLIKLRDRINRNEDSLIYAYYPAIDSLEHTYGPNAEIVRKSVSLLFSQIEELVVPDLEKNNYNLVVSADHGLVNFRQTVIESDSKVMDYLSGPIWGDKRVVYMNISPGKEEEAVEYMTNEYGADFIIQDSESVISSGIFGKTAIDPKIRYRFGTHMMIAKNDSALVYKYPNEEPDNRIRLGTHSGLSKDEMEVPFIVY